VRRITARTPAGLVLVAAVPAASSGIVGAGATITLAVPAAAIHPMEGEG